MKKQMMPRGHVWMYTVKCVQLFFIYIVHDSDTKEYHFLPQGKCQKVKLTFSYVFISDKSFRNVILKMLWMIRWWQELCPCLSWKGKCITKSLMVDVLLPLNYMPAAFKMKPSFCSLPVPCRTFALLPIITFLYAKLPRFFLLPPGFGPPLKKQRFS